MPRTCLDEDLGYALASQSRYRGCVVVVVPSYAVVGVRPARGVVVHDGVRQQRFQLLLCYRKNGVCFRLLDWRVMAERDYRVIMEESAFPMIARQSSGEREAYLPGRK